MEKPAIHKISNQALREVCKVAQGKKCCRYVLCDNDGFHCCKIDPNLADIKTQLDNRVAAGIMVAQGDNCEGI